MPTVPADPPSASQQDPDSNIRFPVPHGRQENSSRADMGGFKQGNNMTEPFSKTRSNSTIPQIKTAPRPIPPGGTDRKRSETQATRAASTNALDPPPPHGLHPYRNSPSSSLASMSHGNLLETSSLASSNAHDNTAVSEPDDPEIFKSNSLPKVDSDANKPRRPSKQVFQSMVSRSRSIKKEHHVRGIPRIRTRERFLDSRSRERQNIESPLTAPIEPDRAYRDAMDSKLRNQSADRYTNLSVDTENTQSTGMSSATAPTTTTTTNSSKAGPGRFTNFMNTSTRLAGDIGRAGKHFFGKAARSGSSSLERDMEENYQFKIINKGLIEQTRRTRIRQRMHEAKDKTEFWMPALPYRCIDYLNLKGVESEGLYRVPGSVKEVRHWQVRFDNERDLNLLDVEDLEDVNTVGSMLKAWLRDLPDELIPKETQKKIAKECEADAGSDNAPQLLKDELSKLPPFNYYLLFAVTAHIALLQKHSEQNKMSYQNLCICFQPSMGIDHFSFHFLVKDWRNCWQGCMQEKEYLDEEYRIMHGEGAQSSRSGSVPPPPSSSSSRQVQSSQGGPAPQSVTSTSTRPTAHHHDSSGSVERKQAPERPERPERPENHVPEPIVPQIQPQQTTPNETSLSLSPPPAETTKAESEAESGSDDETEPDVKKEQDLTIPNGGSNQQLPSHSTPPSLDPVQHSSPLQM